ncbi:MAG: hypothetical protein R3C56_15620 [Pirellulaceae bacterium]
MVSVCWLAAQLHRWGRMRWWPPSLLLASYDPAAMRDGRVMATEIGDNESGLHGSHGEVSAS